MMQESEHEKLRLTPGDALYRKVFVAIVVGVILAILVQAWVIGSQLDTLFVKIGNDNVMRLVTVRNWLAGQGWFDTMEYRLVPPEGTLMHWSRYLDAIIGGLVLFFGLFLPTETAEIAAISVWPTFLAVSVVCVVGFAAKRLFGPVAASVAVLLVLTWPFTSRFYFRSGQIDHHNVQVLMTIVMTLAAVWPQNAIRSGIIAGLAASVALAVGLETLPYILALGLLLFLRATFAVTPQAHRLLAAFCVTLGVGAVALWLGQTPAERIAYPVCDQLGLPVVSLIAIASAASILPLLFGLKAGVVRLGVGVVIVGLGVAVAWPVLSPCLAGPYGSLPVEVQEIIRQSISEAKPAFIFAQSSALALIKMVTPVVATLLIATAFWVKMPRTSPHAAQQRDIVGQLLILCTIGLIAVFFQVRLFSTSAGALPLLAGFAMAGMLKVYLQSRTPADAAKLIFAGVLILAPFTLETLAKPLLPERAQSTTPQDRNCRDTEALVALNAIAPSVLLPPMNLGPAILLHTHHAVLAGPYHRSPAAFANGKIPFTLSEEALQAFLDEVGADHLIVCKGTFYGDGYATELAQGGEATWLTPVDVEAGDLMVFAVGAAE